jgi:hypothetical protein
MKKPMSFLHNIPMHIFATMIRRCTGNHEHQQIIGSAPGYGSRAVISQAYPMTFCKQLVRTIEKVQEHNNCSEVCTPAVEEDLLGIWEDLWEELSYQPSMPEVMTKVSHNPVVPAMPCLSVPTSIRHQEHHTPHPFLHYAMVARPVHKHESTTVPKAIEAMKKEWCTMHEKVWDVWQVREKSEVMRDARRRNAVVQFGRVHGICVEKNSELPDGHPKRKYKGRVVFLGNRVSNQDFEAATFADMGNAPANLESGRLADCYGACPGNASANADGVQAYLQARKRGDPCWVELPPEAHPGNMWGPTSLPAAQHN